MMVDWMAYHCNVVAVGRQFQVTDEPARLDLFRRGLHGVQVAVCSGLHQGVGPNG